jgi:hypothetical protein
MIAVPTQIAAAESVQRKRTLFRRMYHAPTRTGRVSRKHLNAWRNSDRWVIDPLLDPASGPFHPGLSSENAQKDRTMSAAAQVTNLGDAQRLSLQSGTLGEIV